MIRSENIQQSIDFQTYVNLMETAAAGGSTKGTLLSAENIAFTKLNLQRMHRLDKTITLLPELTSLLSKLTKDYLWLVITESWCGDAAQNIPVLHSIEKICPRISLKFLLRDEHLEIMDQYLTNGSRAIPKLICMEKQNLKEVFVWGPRPAKVQEIALKLISQKVSSDEKALAVQKWYNKDKTISIQEELLNIIKEHLV